MYIIFIVSLLRVNKCSNFAIFLANCIAEPKTFTHVRCPVSINQCRPTHYRPNVYDNKRERNLQEEVNKRKYDNPTKTKLDFDDEVIKCII